MKKLVQLLFLPLLFILIANPKAHSALIPVDLELSLLVDVSSSVSADDFNLQKQGYANAFLNSSILSAIQSGATGSIAASLTYWSSAGSQQEAVGWMLINDATSATAFSNAILATSRPFSGTTAPGSAINFAAPSFFSNNFDGAELVIDVSGDGEQNSGADTSDARDAAFAQGITINGIAIGNTSLVNWYNANIKTSNGFVVQAVDFDSFGDAIQNKLAREITPPPPTTSAVPEPASMILLGSGLIGAVILKKRKSI